MNRFIIFTILSSISLCTACSDSGDEAQPTQSAVAVLELTGTSWQVVDIDDNGLVDESTVTLLFPEEGKMVGSAGCNRYFGTVWVDGSSISFGDTGATMMACPEPLMRQEQSFLGALSSISRGEVDADARLVLYDDAGAQRITAIEFVPSESAATKSPPQPMDQASTESFSFDCGQVDDVDVRFLGPDTVELSVADQIFVLPSVRAASGARYSADGVSFWNKGDEALIETAQKRYSCTRN